MARWIARESSWPPPPAVVHFDVGNIRDVGAMDRDTPGSDRIVQVLLDAKPGPAYLQAWGGTNTIARALWKIQHEHPDRMDDVAGSLDRTARPGDRVSFDARGSADPDGDRLTYRWWQYTDADTAESAVDLSAADDGSTVSFAAPNEPGKTVHIVLEVTDTGTPPLTRYQRIIVTIAN